MKWLFATLVALNLIVFAGMIASRMLKQHLPAPQTNNMVQQPQPMVMPAPQIIINTGDLQNASGVTQSAVKPSNASSSKRNSNTSQVATPNNKSNARAQASNKAVPIRSISAQGGAVEPVERLGTPRVQYKACSARVSIPEDDYHRIKGLLNKYPHAASRKIVQGGGNDNGQSSARMDVLFMSVSDQEASSIQGVVGRYGQLSRTPCNK